ncbi:MAG: polysaccharide ABC transporter ATP-binding protein [Alphaproteobacteria bacterium]
MAADVAIRVEGLGKKYELGHAAERERYVALRDVLARGARGVLRRTADMLRGRAVIAGDTVEEFWGLRHVSFEVKRGEVLGIIGRNGAGKSTLLKILSRITEPSEGRVTIKGRVASLLEVGTGFHPELTGRENVFLNGAILGMTRAEIRRKFDEIVAFAEVERFLDTPVKRYSSGMYVRLAFAVAAHLEPEILVVDEVLAVGDAEFQNKCLGKMDQVTRNEGRTVLFVSHNMGTLTSVCGSAILLEAGRMREIGAAGKVVETYLNSSYHRERVEFPADGRKPCITAVAVDIEELRSGNFAAKIEFDSPHALNPPIGGIVIANQAGIPVWVSNGRFHPSESPPYPGFRGALTCFCPRLPLTPAQYSISVWLGNWYEDFDHKRNVLSFRFREDGASVLRPEPITSGSLDWPAVWQFEPSERLDQRRRFGT